MKVRIQILLMCVLLLIPLKTYAKITIHRQGIFVTVMMGPKDIQEVGEKAAAHIEKENKVVKDTLLQKRVDAAAKTVGASFKHPVKILASEQVNAFCTFDSRIYVNTGLLKIVSDDELCFVLAHEVAHAVNNDPEEAFKDQLKAQIALSGAEVEGVVPNLLLKIGEASYSRDKERRADSEAVKNLFMARRDPKAAITLLEKLAKLHPGPQGLGRYFVSHPPAKSRIELVQKVAAEKQSEQIKRLSPPAAKLSHPGQKVLVAFIGKNISVKPPTDFIRRLSDELKAHLNAQGTYPFFDYQEVAGGSTSLDVDLELQSAKSWGAAYLVRLYTLDFQFDVKMPFFSNKVTETWKIKYHASLYRVGDKNLISDLTETFEYKVKRRSGRDIQKVHDQESLAETKFLSDLMHRLFANS